MASPKSRKPEGIAPTLLLDQVKGTAPWAFTLEPRLPSVEILSKAPELEARWKKGEASEDYFAALLAAHFTTVATFCPTDVDQRIRQHVWAQLEGKRFAAFVERVEEVARWDVRPVSARHIVVGKDVLAGHQGEWFSVMSGALGRALALSDAPMIERTRDWIETELTREAKIIERVRKKGSDHDLLAVVTTVAHNLGDLSRVVDTWRPVHAASELGRRYQRLGHEDGERLFDGVFLYAGDLNKKLMAKENHRFLPLRAPKALRRERAFLLPFGPYFYDWGRMIGSTKLLDDSERAEVVLALLTLHERSPEEHGCLRAIAGIHSTSPVDKLGRLLSPAQSVLLKRGSVQLALRQSEADFLKKFHAGIER